jgi:hypothetical protein
MFQLFSNVCCDCFYLDVVYVVLAIHVYCKCMFQMFQLFETSVAISDVVYVVVRQCPYTDMFFSNAYTRMLQGYVLNVSSFLDVCCKCSMSKREKWVHVEMVPLGITVPACVGSKADVAGACVP